MRVYLFLLLVASFLAIQGFAKWVGPIKLLPTLDSDSYIVTSTYRDPTSHVNHLYYVEDCAAPHYQGYLAVSDTGEILHQTKYLSQGWFYGGTIRGAGDGQHLYLAIQSNYYKGAATVNLSESIDGGASWSQPSSILPNSDPNKFFQDMLYISETGRIFVFFFEEDSHALKVITRTPGSTVFSNPIVIATDFETNRVWRMNSKAVYNIWLNRQLIYIFYVNRNDKLAYSRSATNGATWTSPKVISNDNVYHVTEALANHKFSETIYVSYALATDSYAKLIKTDDYGVTFTEPKSITKNYVNSGTTDGLALCGTKNMVMLSAFFPTTSGTAEYSLVDSETFEPFYKQHPFTESTVKTAGLDCTIDVPKSQLDVAIFVSKDQDLLFALESDYYPTSEQLRNYI
eukprot:TRINITY_DN212_c0_g1_i1.p1 TRINITY_DN212_c0_g1~~TRINITY_DN212_c0_g1_i1.p1  ORF type:complete len:401 (-),score=26.03 TRINITY_DN212_c0_g1_i1:192-1394(-)